jgi:ABC-type lipoprotein release transport system permease subunit
MAKIRLIGRLVGRDLRRRPGPAVLLVLAITAATATLTLGLVLHGVTSQPYLQTRAATNGPDVVVQIPGFGPTLSVGPPGRSGHRHHPPPQAPASQAQTAAQIKTLTHAPGVTGHSGPYPVASAIAGFQGIAAPVEVEGRTAALASIEQPKVTTGTWVRSGGVVLERTFAEALGVGVGDRITLDGRPYRVTGIAVTAAGLPYPNLCYYPGGGCVFDAPDQGSGIVNTGFAWSTEPDARSLASTQAPLSYFLNLKLKDPATAPAFASSHGSNPSPSAPTLIPWQAIQTGSGLLVQDEQQVLSPGAWLAGLLAIASVAVLAGGRMAERTRWVGLLKAVGGTPGTVAVVLLAENLVLALLAAAAGLAIGWLTAPLVASPGAALVGTPGAPAFTLSTVGLVVAVALVVALAATLAPAIRAARTSTVSALADTARRPRRRAGLIAISARLPVPLLLGLRLVARRPRRALLSVASVAVTTTGVVAVLAFHTTAHQKFSGAAGEVGNPVIARDEQMLMIITVVLVALTVLNAICAAWATVLDARPASALARALGASPQQITAGIATAQVVPALPGVLLGIPLGIGLFAVAAQGTGVVVPPAPWLAAAVLGTLVAIAGLATIPARIGARHPVAEILQAEA